MDYSSWSEREIWQNLESSKIFTYTKLSSHVHLINDDYFLLCIWMIVFCHSVVYQKIVIGIVIC